MTGFVSLLVGDGSVLVRCGELLMAKGHRVQAVISTDLTAVSYTHLDVYKRQGVTLF